MYTDMVIKEHLSKNGVVCGDNTLDALFMIQNLTNGILENLREYDKGRKIV